MPIRHNIPTIYNAVGKVKLRISHLERTFTCIRQSDKSHVNQRLNLPISEKDRKTKLYCSLQLCLKISRYEQLPDLGAPVSATAAALTASTFAAVARGAAKRIHAHGAVERNGIDPPVLIATCTGARVCRITFIVVYVAQCGHVRIDVVTAGLWRGSVDG